MADRSFGTANSGEAGDIWWSGRQGKAARMDIEGITEKKKLEELAPVSFNGELLMCGVWC